jgi:hypothetical protein
MPWCASTSSRKRQASSRCSAGGPTGQRAAPVEEAATGEQGEKQRGEQRGLFPVEALQQREQRADAEPGEREQVARVDALLDRARQ